MNDKSSLDSLDKNKHTYLLLFWPPQCFSRKHLKEKDSHSCLILEESKTGKRHFPL